MKAYLLTSGAIFGLITAIHIWRLALEPNILTQPWFLLITVCAAAFCVWAIVLFGKLRECRVRSRAFTRQPLVRGGSASSKFHDSVLIE